MSSLEIRKLGEAGDIAGLDRARMSIEVRKSTRLRLVLVDALRMGRNPRAFDSLAALLEDDAMPVRFNAVEALADLGGPEAGARLAAAAARDGDSRVRARAVEAIGDVAPSSQAPVLVNALSDPSDVVRNRACVALGKGRVRGAVQALGEVLDDRSGIVRSAACRSLVEIGTEDAADVLEATADGAGYFRRMALRQAVRDIRG